MVLIKTDQNGLITSLAPDQSPVSVHPVQLFPNPAGQFVTASYILSRAGQTAIRLLDMEGRLVASLAPTTAQAGGEHQVTVDLSGIPAGCYFVEVATAFETWTARLIKQ